MTDQNREIQVNPSLKQNHAIQIEELSSQKTTKQSINKPTKFSYLTTKASIESNNIDFSKIDQKKIENYINILKKYQMECVKNGNFLEAELTKHRVHQLNHITEKKLFNEAKKKQNQEYKNFLKLKKNEINSYLEIFEKKYDEELLKMDNQIDELKAKHEKELNEYLIDFANNCESEENKYPNEMAEKKKKLEYFIKKEE